MSTLVALLCVVSCKERATDAPPGRSGRPATVDYRTARAQLKGVDGWVQLAQKIGDPTVTVTAQVKGLKAGSHAFHVHEHGDCSGAGFASAGGHFAPEGHPHGAPGPKSHAGDLGNLKVVAPEKLTVYRIEAKGLTLGHGERSAIGRAVVIHEGKDDLESQPSGAAGRRVACGVIKRAVGEPSPRLEKATSSGGKRAGETREGETIARGTPVKEGVAPW